MKKQLLSICLISFLGCQKENLNDQEEVTIDTETNFTSKDSQYNLRKKTHNELIKDGKFAKAINKVFKIDKSNNTYNQRTIMEDQ
jgi:hypothetical protein